MIGIALAKLGLTFALAAGFFILADLAIGGRTSPWISIPGGLLIIGTVVVVTLSFICLVWGV